MTSNMNMSIWDSVQKTDPKYTKAFSRTGGFKGTATNATYLAMKATQTFGPMGIGWGVQVIDEKILQGAPLGDNAFELIHKIHAKLWYVRDGVRGEVEQFGQTQFVGKNKNGLYTDEEAPKKSLTDAMSKCLSLLGFSADIHLGLYDDNKYVNSLREEFAEKPELLTEAQEIELRDLADSVGANIAKFLEYMKADKMSSILAKDYAKAKSALEAKARAAKPEAAALNPKEPPAVEKTEHFV